MELNEFMAKYKSLVEKELEKFFKEKKKENTHKITREVVEVIEEYTLRGGKRIRPILMILAYKMFGGKEEDKIIKAAASLELIQSYFLIHDDIMDESELRRGKKTVHKIYEEKHLKNGYPGNPARFGENLAIIAGDLANVYAMEMFMDSKFDGPKFIKALNKLNEIIEYTGYGQIIDVYSSALHKFEEKDLLLLHEYKTANYTIYGPLSLGAILAGGEPAGLRDFAIPIGIAFQLQDDILGLFGDEERIGKPVTSDLAEGKKTLLIIKALENADESEAKEILMALGNPAVTDEQLKRVREIVKSTGSYDYSVNLARKMVKEANRHIESMNVKNENYKKILIELGNYMIERTM